MKTFRLAASVLAGLAAVVSFVRADSPEFADVDVVVEMTAAGRKIAHPTPDSPVYYHPVPGGYTERGSMNRDEPPPPSPVEVAHILSGVLAEQGYLVMDPAHKPSLILSMHWGSINPIKGVHGIVTNSSEMLAMVTGKTMTRMDLNSFEYRWAIANSRMDRYFILVIAYDYDAYTAYHKKVKLWQANISVPANHVALAGVLPIMARVAGPLLGRETALPKSTLVPFMRGDVEMGPTTVVPDKPAAAAK